MKVIYVFLSQTVQTSSQSGTLGPFLQPEAIFGGVVLLGLLWLLLLGKIRTEREVDREKEIITVQQGTIDQQRETIKALTSKDRETLHLLRELRTAAIARGDLHFSDMIEDEIGEHNV